VKPAAEPSVSLQRRLGRALVGQVSDMQREKAVARTRRGLRTRRRILWFGALPRPVGAGLPPGPIPVPNTVALPGPASPGPTGDDQAGASRRAEIAAEEARLASLRTARAQLEQEIAALREEAERRRSEMPGRKVVPENLASGPTPAPAAAAGGGQATPAVAPGAPGAAGRGLRVFVHHRANSPPGASAAEEVAQTLRGAGVEVPAIRPAPFVPSTPVVRYFHEEDQTAAARLASRLGRGWAIQDFRAFVPQPPPQTLEVWLPSS
jgi:hypothetical protein